MENRRFVTRACPMCEWEGAGVEVSGGMMTCPTCHAPTRVLREEWLIPAVTGETRNPHAAELGRIGGLKGGKARAASLSPRRRREIARKAAEARWRSR